MSERWWYVRDGAVLGPTLEVHLVKMLKAGELGPGHWVWTPSLANWTPIRDIGSIQPHLGRTDLAGDPLPHPMLPLPDPSGPLAARPLSRLLAQLVDLVIASVIMAIIWALSGIEFTTTRANSLAENLLAIATIPLSLLLQVPMLALTGTSPGKVLLGLCLVRRDGGRPDLVTLLRRQARLWLMGFGLGLAIAPLVTGVLSRRRLVRGQQTLWDEALDLRVWEHGPGRARQIVAVLLYLGFMIGSHLLANFADKYTREMEQETGRVTPTPPSSSTWRNPVTGKVGKLITGWIVEVVQEEDGGSAHWFWTQGRDGQGMIRRDFIDRPFPEFAADQLKDMAPNREQPFPTPSGSQPTCIQATSVAAADEGSGQEVQALRLCGLASGEVWTIRGWWPQADEPEKVRVEGLLDGLESTLY